MAGTPKNSVGRKSRNSCRGFLMLEAFQQAHAASADEPAMQAVAEAVDVEEREREQETIGARDLPAGEKIERVRGQVVVREDGALGDAGGAGGVDDAGGRIAIQSNLRPFVGQGGGFAREIRGIPDGRGAGELSCGDHGHGFGVGEDVVQLALAIEDVDGNEDHAQLDAGQIQIDHLDAVGQINTEAVAGLQAALCEQLSQAIAAGVDVAEGVAERLGIRERCGRAVR